jgi:signal transduction histidine kinase
MSRHEDTDPSFARVVSLACHDLRTPLATVLGFARTLGRSVELEPPADRYVEMIDLAAGPNADLLDVLSLAARIETGRWDPVRTLVPVDEIVRAAAVRGEAAVVPGEGGVVDVDRETAVRAVGAFAEAARRHGGLDRVELQADGADVLVRPVAPDVAPIVLGDDLRDLGAAVAVRIVRALGGDAAVEGEALRVRLPSRS